MTQEIASVDTDQWLGCLVESNSIYSSFRLLSHFDGKQWRHVKTGKVTQAFPANLTVHGEPDAELRKRIGTFWLFRCRAPKGTSANWTTEGLERAFPVLDYSKSSMADARKALCDTGIRLPEKAGNQAVVLLADDLCAQLRFEHDRRSDLWHAKLPDGIVELRRTNLPGIVNEKEGPNYIRFTTSMLGSDVVSTVLWARDAEFLELLVNRYRAALATYLGVTGTGSSGRALSALKALVPSSAGTATEIQAIIERLRSEWPQLTRSLDGIEALTELLLESEQGKKLLERAVSARAVEINRSIEARADIAVAEKLAAGNSELNQVEESLRARVQESVDLNALLAELQDVRVNVEREVGELKSELNTTRDLVSSARAELVSCDSDLATALGLRADQEAATHVSASELRALQTALESLVRETRGAFENASLTADASAIALMSRRIEDALSGTTTNEPALIPQSLPPWVSPTRRTSEFLEADMLPDRLENEAERSGVHEEDLFLLDAFSRAGEPVLLAGPVAERCLHAFASVVSGGEIHSHSLDPACIGLDDLWRTSGSGRPTAFALAWHRAQVRSDEYVVVCLRDLDSAPFRLWLSSLRAILDGEYRPRNLLVVLTPSSLSEDLELPHFEDPINQLVALTPRGSPEAIHVDLAVSNRADGATRLRWAGEIPEVSLKAYSAVTSGVGDASAARRALNLAAIGAATNETLLRRVAVAWVCYLARGESSSLPPALLAGLRRLGGLRATR